MWPLIRMGYVDEPHRFFEFCQRAMHPSGYLMHKYRADGALGSSWHSYLHEDGRAAPPIQEDETALVLFVFTQYYHMHASPRLLREFYHSMITPMAHFLAGYVHNVTGLPHASYDLWEERYLTTTYSTAVVYAALLAAAELAEIAEDADNAVKWRTCADDIYEAAQKHLFNAEKGTLRKGLVTKNNEIIYDDTVDASSVFGSFMFGLFAADSPEVSRSIKTIKDTFGLSEHVIGIPRYENDNYCRTDPSSKGNWWIITTLWLAQYHLEIHQPDEARRILSWVKDHAGTTGILPEQLNPLDERFVSVAPLTWSHAEYVATLLDTISEEQKT